VLKLVSTLFVWVILTGQAYCNPIASIPDEHFEKNTDNNVIVTKKLQNGMRVILKQTPYDAGQVYIRMLAPGGYASLPQESIASGVVSIHAALDSGFEEISADHFYTEDIELSIELLPYYRRIQGFSETQEFPKLLSYINKYFKIKTFKSDAFNEAKEEVLKKLASSKKSFECVFQNMFLNINMQDFKPMRHPEVEDIKKADMKLSQEIFKRLFANPSEFVVVVVGDFNPEKMMNELESNLGTIPASEAHFDFNRLPPPSFPKENTTKVISAPEQKNSLARLTFPVTLMNLKTYTTLSLLEEFLRDYIGKKLKQKFSDDIGLEVFFENPIYPREELSLYVIQYRCETALINKIREAILEEIKKLCANGISQKQLDITNKKLKEGDSFWLRDNTYWLTLLTDYSAAHWPIKEVTGTPEELSQVKLEQLNTTLREVFCGNKHTFLYSSP
jgi:zinc protease